jgi:hypothetical protein
MTEDNRAFVIESPTKITLRPIAKFWAEQHGMTLEQMGRYLLQQYGAQQQEETPPFAAGGTVPGASDYDPMNNFDLMPDKFGGGFG